MTVAQLIAALQRCPPDAKMYKEGGDYKDDWREVQTVSQGQVWGLHGVFIE